MVKLQNGGIEGATYIMINSPAVAVWVAMEVITASTTTTAVDVVETTWHVKQSKITDGGCAAKSEQPCEAR